SKMERIPFSSFESPDEWKISQHLPSICLWKGDTVLRRIGSSSTRAMVFQVIIDGINMACKILIDTELNTTEKNNEEVKISKFLGDKYPEYFPKVYFVGHCDNVMIPPGISNKELIDNGILYQLMSRIKNEPKLVQKKLYMKYHLNYDINVYLDFLRIKDITEIKIP